ncbi:MAG TPA: hypothetical protein VI547_11745 [Anaerolineales bacterium]|nr:hypothetical protein [Anaerolineales bacterium]
MKRNVNILIGLALVGLGILYLLQNFGRLTLANYVWPIVFAAGGLAFLVGYFTSRAHWWPLIPGFTLLGLAAASGSEFLFPRLENEISGPLFLGGVSLGFWATYIFHRQNWWALIPGGVLMTLATVAAADEVYGSDRAGAVFFVGLAATFAIVFIATRQTWALFPAGGLLAFGLFILVGLERFIDYLWPAVLIFAGAFLLFRALRPAPR